MAYRAGFDRRWPAGGAYFAEPFASRARAPVFRDSIDTALVSLANETSGTLSNTEYSIQSGSWRVVADSSFAGGQAVECFGPGVTEVPDTTAYGTWYFDVCKCAAASKVRVDFISVGKDTADLGYRWEIEADEQIRLIEKGVFVHMSTANGYTPLNKAFSACVTRSAAGVFTAYDNANGVWRITDVSGGSGANPFTDTTQTTNQYMLYDMDTTDKISNMRHLQGVVPPI